LVQSWWLTGKTVSSILQHAADIITDTQHRKARSRKSHRKRTLRRLHALDIYIHRLPKCGWDDG
jgi:hypothetical protein